MYIWSELMRGHREILALKWAVVLFISPSNIRGSSWKFEQSIFSRMLEIWGHFHWPRMRSIFQGDGGALKRKRRFRAENLLVHWSNSGLVTTDEESSSTIVAVLWRVVMSMEKWIVDSSFSPTHFTFKQTNNSMKSLSVLQRNCFSACQWFDNDKQIFSWRNIFFNVSTFDTKVC